MKKVLYVSYDGMTDPLGQSQVIPYLCGLSQKGYKITLLSFEKKERLQKLSAHIHSILDGAGIRWETRLFSKRPPLLAKLYDTWCMKKAVRHLHREENFDFIHCRSYVAAGAGLQMSKRYKIPFLFDMRGFWVDERVDNGQWDLKNPLFRMFYRYYKKKEKAYFKEARHIISLTWKGKEELENKYAVPGDKITVIPCCVDLDHFNYKKITEEEKNSKKAQLNIVPGDVIISYLGSLGGWYLVREMLDFFAELKKALPRAKILFITQDIPGLIYRSAAESNVGTESIIVQPASRNEVPLYLSLSDYSIFFIKDAYSKRASSPTKQGEIMAMGIPLICNDIGDTGKIIEASGAGLLVKEFNVSGYQKIIDQLQSLREINKEHIRLAAFDYYDLQKGIKEYSTVYKSIAG
ncbi:MAG: glycosyltransferase [Bacteroidota bacterium]|nr:glycosyltransferase [Bacteroidota bacterium]